MASSSESSSSSVTIVDLNDDCLREVFKRLTAADLGSVADVCTRFKSIAQKHFAYSKYKRLLFRSVEFDDAWNFCKSPYDANTLKPTQVSKILRNFGAFIEEINVGDEFEKNSEKYQKGIVDLLARFSSEKLVKLHLWRFDITDEIANKLQPVLRSLQALSLKRCTWGESLKMLPKWSPELQELNLYGQPERGFCIFNGLRQNFPNLERFSFENSELDLEVIKDFVKFNPQIKEATFKDYRDLTPTIFRIIVKHLPQIEKLAIDSQALPHAQYFGELTNLKSLSIDAHYIEEPEESTDLFEIDFAKIPLESLELSEFDFSGDFYWPGEFDQAVVTLSKLTNLKRLKLSQVSGMNAAHIVAMCEHHSQLTELHLIDNKRLALSIQNLLDILRNATKLEKLIYVHDPLARECSKDDSEPEFENANHEQVFCIDAETYEKFVQVVHGRSHKTYLSIDSPLYRACKIPDELLELHKNHIELNVMEDDEESDESEDEDSDEYDDEDDDIDEEDYEDDVEMEE